MKRPFRQIPYNRVTYLVWIGCLSPYQLSASSLKIAKGSPGHLFRFLRKFDSSCGHLFVGCVDVFGFEYYGRLAL